MDKESLVQKKQLILSDLNKQILLPLKSNKIVNHMMTKKIKVLMTGAGAPGGPGIIQAIKKDSKINLYIADADSNASGRFLRDKCPFYKIPNADDNNFVNYLLNLCIELLKVVLPLVTKELFKLSANKQNSRITT